VEEYAFTSARFDSLASGYGDPDALGILVDSQITRRRLMVVAAAEQDEPALRLLAGVERQAPHVVRDLLGHPFLGVWFARTAGSGPYLAGLAAAAAVRARLPFAVTVPCAERDLVLPTLGTVVGVGPGPVSVSGDGSSVRVTGPRGEWSLASPHWQPIRTVQVGALTLAVDDADPYRDCYPCPPAERLPAVDFQRLAGLCREAGGTLDREQPQHTLGLRAALRVLVPVCNPREGTDYSATSAAAFGAIGIALPGDASTLAELLIHEFQHLKLDALAELVPLCRLDGPARYYAPWRPEPRPAWPLMQGCYAYVGVTGFWRIHRHSAAGAAARRAHFEFAYWRRQTSVALAQLAGSDELTAAGVAFVDLLRRTLSGWRAEQVPDDAEQAAERCAVADRSRWRLAHQGTGSG
jgi:HEXXH motif-containing protein